MTVFGVEDSSNEAGAMQDAPKKFGDANGINVTYVGRRDFEQQINTQVLGGNPPDIAAFPQPGKLAQFAQDGSLIEVPADVAADVAKNWDDSFLAFSKVDGKQYGVPIKNDLKSLVWYVPSVWKAKGYEVPKTLTEFKALEDKMIANGDTPLCVGIESGPATGWPFTDWVEELVLREQGIDYYNKWVDHKVPFDDQPIVDTFNEVAGPDGTWKEGRGVLVGRVDRGDGVRRQRRAARQRQVHDAPPGELLRAFFPEGTKFGTGAGEVSTFYFPSDSGHPVLVGGINVGAFRDAARGVEGDGRTSARRSSPTTVRRPRRAASAAATPGSSPATRTPTRASGNPLEQGFLETLATASPAAFDAVGPDAGRRRLGQLLDGRDVVRQRRRGRQDGGVQHRSVVAELR